MTDKAPRTGEGKLPKKWQTLMDDLEEKIESMKQIVQ